MKKSPLAREGIFSALLGHSHQCSVLPDTGNQCLSFGIIQGAVAVGQIVGKSPFVGTTILHVHFALSLTDPVFHLAMIAPLVIEQENKRRIEY